MAKDWKIRQTALVKGVQTTATFILPFMAEADVTAFCANLEGGYEVTEINEAMSSMANAEINAASSTSVKSISIRGENNQSTYISAFGGSPIHFKNTVSGDDIRATLANKMIFEYVPTAKVTYVTIKEGESLLS